MIAMAGPHVRSFSFVALRIVRAMIDKDKITYRHWSLQVGRTDPATGIERDANGEIVFAVDDLHQSITNLVLTQKGTVPTEPEKGVDMLAVIDKHPDIGIPTLTRDIWDALLIWEPRIVVQNVAVVMVAYAHFATRVFWRPIESVLDDLLVTEVTYRG